MPLITEQQQLANREQLRKLQEELNLARQIGTSRGFYETYFKALGTNIGRTNFETFNEINQKYFDLFGEYKYSCWNSFRNASSKYLKK